MFGGGTTIMTGSAAAAFIAGMIAFFAPCCSGVMMPTYLAAISGGNGRCVAAITREVLTVTGVESVDVDLDAKTVTVIAESLDEQAVIAAIDEAGYEVAA